MGRAILRHSSSTIRRILEFWPYALIAVSVVGLAYQALRSAQ